MSGLVYITLDWLRIVVLQPTQVREFKIDESFKINLKVGRQSVQESVKHGQVYFKYICCSSINIMVKRILSFGRL